MGCDRLAVAAVGSAAIGAEGAGTVTGAVGGTTGAASGEGEKPADGSPAPWLWEGSGAGALPVPSGLRPAANGVFRHLLPAGIL